MKAGLRSELRWPVYYGSLRQQDTVRRSNIILRAYQVTDFPAIPPGYLNGSLQSDACFIASFLLTNEEHLRQTW